MITNLISANGRAVANQFVIVENEEINFQSYNSLVCSIRPSSMGYDRVIVFGCDYDYSNTTMKHLRKFLADNGFSYNSMAELRRDIEKGRYHNDEAIAIWYDETMV